MRYLLLLVMTAALLSACGGEGVSGDTVSAKERPSNPFALTDAPAETRLKKSTELAPPGDPRTTVASANDEAAAVVAAAEKVEEVAPKPEPKRLAPAKATFVSKAHNYGNITEGETVEHTFVLENTGQRPLEILKTTGSCGCTIASYSFLPIKPGEKTEIKARFDSQNKLGNQKTTITVTTNGQPRTHILSLEGVVRPAEDK